jgi:hypothetical protein
MRLDLIGRKDLPISFGRWKLTHLLGEGGMARVFRGELHGGAGFRKPAAVKVVLPGIGDKAAQLRRQLLQEARVGALLNHPNIVQTFDCGELEGYPFIAMELVEGVGLQELVQACGRLPPCVGLDVVAQVAGGLHHAHTAVHDGRELRVIHRDVKPSNILLRGDGVAKVVDFGIAKAAVDDALSTSTGMTKGTPAYMSPEQLAADPLDARSDLFALGAVLYYLLWGRTLFSGQSITEVMLRIIQVDETLAQRGVFAEAEQLVPGLGDLLASMLVKDPERRFPNSGVAAKALLELRAGLPEHPTTSRFVTEYLDARDAGAGFGSAPPPAGRAVQELRPDGFPPPSDFQRRVEAAREGGVDWIESTAGEADGPGATRLVPVPERAVAGAAAEPSGFSDLSLSRMPSPRGGWTSGAPSDDVGRTRAMPASRGARIPPDADASGEWERRRARGRTRRRVIMGSLVVACVAAGVWIAGDFGDTNTRVASLESVSTSGVGDAVGLEEVSAPPGRDARSDGGRPGSDPPPEFVEKGASVPASTASAENGGASPLEEQEATSSAASAPVPEIDGDGVVDASPPTSPEGAAVDSRPPDDESDEGATEARSGADFEEPRGAEVVESRAVSEGSAGSSAAESAASAGEPSPTVRTAPAGLPLRISHRPFTMATVGTSKKLQVYAAGPDDVEVVVFWGPKGGSPSRLVLRKAGTGVWEGLLPITADLRDAGGLQYWVVVSHPSTTPRRLQSGSPDGPHEVTVF